MASIAIGGEITGVYTPARGMRRRASLWNGATPEVFFAKRIDNSRLVKLDDPQRAREIRMFSIACALFFMVFLTYSWQHFRAIEYGYKIEAQRIEHDHLVEQQRELSLQEASLRDPQRIDVLARRMGLVAPHAGQVVTIDGASDLAQQSVMASVLPMQRIAPNR